MEQISVEVILKCTSNQINKETCTSYCNDFLRSSSSFKCNEIISAFDKDREPFLHENVQAIVIGETRNQSKTYIDFTNLEIIWHICVLDQSGPQTDTTEDEGGNLINLATHWILPNEELFGIWENLIYGFDIKKNVSKNQDFLFLLLFHKY